MEATEGKQINENQITTKDMFEILRSDILEVKSQISDVRSDIQALDDRLRNVEAAVAGTRAVATYQNRLIDWVFRIAAVIGVGGAIKAFFS